MLFLQIVIKISNFPPKLEKKKMDYTNSQSKGFRISEFLNQLRWNMPVMETLDPPP